MQRTRLRLRYLGILGVRGGVLKLLGIFGRVVATFSHASLEFLGWKRLSHLALEQGPRRFVCFDGGARRNHHANELGLSYSPTRRPHGSENSCSVR
jgi:hypothetical protein